MESHRHQIKRVKFSFVQSYLVKNCGCIYTYWYTCIHTHNIYIYIFVGVTAHFVCWSRLLICQQYLHHFACESLCEIIARWLKFHFVPNETLHSFNGWSSIIHPPNAHKHTYTHTYDWLNMCTHVCIRIYIYICECNHYIPFKSVIPRMFVMVQVPRPRLVETIAPPATPPPCGCLEGGRNQQRLGNVPRRSGDVPAQVGEVPAKLDLLAKIGDLPEKLEILPATMR